MPGRDFDRDAGRNGGLACRILPLTGGEDLAQNDFGYIRWLHTCTFERFLDRHLAQLVSREGRQGPVECSNRRANRTDDDDIVLHLKTPFRIRLDGDGG